MALVRSALPYPAFIAGRDVSNALHREDGAAGYVVGKVARVRSADEKITQEQYDTEAQAIRQYNEDHLPPPEPEPEPPPTLRERLTGVTTIAAIRDALIEHFEG